MYFLNLCISLIPKIPNLLKKSKLSFSFLRLAISYPKEWKPFFGIFLKKVHIYNPWKVRIDYKLSIHIGRSSNQIDSWLTVDLTNKKLEKNICGRSGNQIDSWLTVGWKNKGKKPWSWVACKHDQVSSLV